MQPLQIGSQRPTPYKKTYDAVIYKHVYLYTCHMLKDDINLVVELWHNCLIYSNVRVK